MSTQEMDAIVGRLVRERAEATRERAALDAELANVVSTCRAIFDQPAFPGADELGRRLEPIDRYFNVVALTSLVQRRDEALARIVAKNKALAELGVGWGC